MLEARHRIAKAPGSNYCRCERPSRRLALSGPVSLSMGRSHAMWPPRISLHAMSPSRSRRHVSRRSRTHTRASDAHRRSRPAGTRARSGSPNPHGRPSRTGARSPRTPWPQPAIARFFRGFTPMRSKRATRREKMAGTFPENRPILAGGQPSPWRQPFRSGDLVSPKFSKSDSLFDLLTAQSQFLLQSTKILAEIVGADHKSRIDLN